MRLRKMNAGLSLLTTVLLLDHAIFLAVWMLSMGSVPKSGGFMPWILMGATVIHALISIDLAVSAHMGDEEQESKVHPKGKLYVKLNRSTIVQRASGILMLLFVGPHVAGATGLMQPSGVVHGIVPPLFFAVALTHVAVSTSKAFITLGIGNAKFVKTVDVVIKVLCVATLVADVVGFYRYRW